MRNLEQLQLLAQLVDSIEIAVEKLGDSYKEKDSEKFYNSKKAILGFQKEVAKQIKVPDKITSSKQIKPKRKIKWHLMNYSKIWKESKR